MVPIVLGGIALAAVGYGVKKYLDSDIDKSLEFNDSVCNIIEQGIDAMTEFEEKYLMPDWYYDADQDMEDV